MELVTIPALLQLYSCGLPGGGRRLVKMLTDSEDWVRPAPAFTFFK